MTVIDSHFCGNTPQDMVATTISVTAVTACDPCQADLDDNGFVGVGDMLLMFANWGPCP